jgi:GH25 family lysozyme M1 (1,4-beta-N-acetylmuramidase)
MSESNLRKEFSKRDVQRMRNIITGNAGASTGTQVGYTKQSQDYQEGDTWEENGKQWTIKNGIKQTITKFDSLKKHYILPLACPVCNKAFKNDDINKKMWSIHHKCFDCVIDMEMKIKYSGKWDEYEKQMMNNNKNAMLDDFEASFEEFLKFKNDSYMTEAGDVETWGGGKVNEEEIKNVKEYIKKLREHQL